MILVDIMSPFNTDMVRYKSLIDSELDTIYINGPTLLREPINYIKHGGKRLRPSLCMLICDMFDVDIEKALVPSVSIELLHLFSLVHDDIMDDDNLRHNKITLHKKWNTSVAILAGDAILALAFKHLNNTNNTIKELFNGALIAVCEGQALDIEYESLNSVSKSDYLNMVDFKTGHMIGLSAQLGGILSNLNIDDINKLNNYGKLIGRAFQIQDDLLEILSTSIKMGKTLDSDFILGKKTYLMIEAQRLYPEEYGEISDISLKDNKKGFKKFKELLEQSGIISDCKDYIHDTFLKADKEIDTIKYKKNLKEFTKLIKNRKF